MKYKDPVTGELKDIYVKASDTLPVGTVVDYDGEDVPAGWEKIDDYSTNETKIGTWIDGKPLYRKVLNFNETVNVNETFTKSHGISNVDQLFIRHAYLYVPMQGLNYPLNQVGYNGNLTEKCYCWADRNNVYLYSNSGYNTNWYKCFILEYTKTTD